MLTGCGTDRQDEAALTGPDHAPVAAADLVDPTKMVWSLGTTLHWPDGHTTDLGVPASQLVVAGPGVYFLTDDDAEVMLATPDGRVRGTGEVTYRLLASPDGRHLTFIDWAHGEEGKDEGPNLAVAVILDLVDGEDVLRTSDGLGASPDDDLGQLYEGAGDTVVEAITNDTAWIRHPEGFLRVDLATGGTEQAGDGPTDLSGPVTEPRLEWNGAHTWAFDRSWDNRAPVLRHRNGRSVRPRLAAPEWVGATWLDDTHALLLGSESPVPLHELTTVEPWSCAVPSGRCTRIPGREAGLETYADSNHVPPPEG